MGKKCTGRNTQKKRTTWKEDNINIDIYATGREREVWKGLISQRTRTVTRLLWVHYSEMWLRFSAPAASHWTTQPTCQILKFNFYDSKCPMPHWIAHLLWIWEYQRCGFRKWGISYFFTSWASTSFLRALRHGVIGSLTWFDQEHVPNIGLSFLTFTDFYGKPVC
jgi:hypothetical protein